MKTLVINLARRPDRLAFFTKTNEQYLNSWEIVQAIDGRELTIEKVRELGFDTNNDWRDPIRKTKLSRGEVGCFMSHYAAWAECIELDEPVIILEDDAVFTDKFYELEVENLMQKFDLLYLARKEMEPNKVRKLDEKLEVPYYPYWCLAYCC